MQLTFSIVTPSFNRFGFIEKTIQSVLRQEYSALDYIVVDGESTDGTLDILEKYNTDSRFSYISEKDQGMYDAINKGFERATGDILAYINTDDRYFPWTLSVVERFFREHEDVDFVYGDTLVRSYPEGHSRLHLYIPTPTDWLRACLLFAQPTVFFRRKCFQAIGVLSKDVRLVADCEYWLRLAEAGFTFRKIHEFLAIETNHQDTLRDRYMKQIEDEKRLLFDTYSRGMYRNNAVRSVILNTEALGRILLYSAFIAKSRGFLGFLPWWSFFLENYRVEKGWLKFISEKLNRRPINWSVKESETVFSERGE